MKQEVVLSLRGQQTYENQDPDVIELITDGTLEQVPSGWVLQYEESALTGLEGVQTSFLLEKDCVTLTRTGKLSSQMVFREGIPHESLYQMEFGVLMMSICANSINWDITWEKGRVDLSYRIEIEHSVAGNVEYHLEIQKK